MTSVFAEIAATVRQVEVETGQAVSIAATHVPPDHHVHEGDPIATIE